MAGKQEKLSGCNRWRVGDMAGTYTSKKLVRGAFESADLPRLPFFPWIFTHAARLQQIPLRRMFTDPTQYTKCLQNAQKLYGYDGIVGSFDSSLEAEICGRPVKWGADYEVPVVTPDPGFDFNRLKDVNVEGAAKTGRFGTVIESLRRINKVVGANLALAAVVSGPLTLVATLTGRVPLHDLTEEPEKAMRYIESAAGFLLKVVQVYGQLELDVIAIADRLISHLSPDHLSWLRSVFSPVINTVRFYNACSILLPGESPPENITCLLDLGFDGIVAFGIDATTWQRMKNGHSRVLGKAIPAPVLNSGAKEIKDYLDKYVPEKIEPGVFLTTDWEVPAATAPENIQLIMNLVSKKLKP
jgi:uroporphyrinogen-III decarboxylase